MNLEEILKDKKFIKIPLVGNKFTGNKITSKDLNIIFELDNDNIYDKNAVKVFSKYNSRIKHIGFISKEKNIFWRKNKHILKFNCLIKKTVSENKYYYLIFEKLKFI